MRWICVQAGGAAALLSAAACVGGLAQGKVAAHWPTNEDLRHLRAMGSARLSPNGTEVLLEVTDSTADGAASHLWLVDVAGGEPRQLTFSPEGDKRGERSGQWAPDGRSVFFLAKRGERVGLFRLPMDGGEARRFALKTPVTVDASKSPGAIPPESARGPAAAPAPSPDKGKPEEAELEVSGFAGSPDGKWIAVIARDPETAGEKRQKDAKADASWVDHDQHGERLWLLDSATGKLTTVAGVPADVRSIAWSRDGARFAAVVEGPNGVSDLRPAATAWMVSMADIAHPSLLENVPATVGDVVWAEDGRSLLLEAQAKADAPPGVRDLYRYTLATRDLRDLTDGYSGSIAGGMVALHDGAIAAKVEEGFRTGPAIVRDGKPPEMAKEPMRTVDRATTNLGQTGWILVGSGGGHAQELLYTKTLGAETRVLTTPPMGWDDLRRGVGREIRWTNEGLTIQGMLYLPEKAGVGGGKVPLIVDVHGGPTGAFSDRHEPLYDLFLGRGWAVLVMNPRGSTGRGAAFAAANKDDLGGADLRDLMAGVDFVVRSEAIDPGKLALMGYSYGGEMAGFVEGQTDRFRAIVSGAPVTDQFSEYGTEQGSWYDRWFYGKPWEHAEAAVRQSPLGHVAGAKTPMLLLQGESDATDPLGQSQEMYRVLRQMGVAVDLVTYPREDHGPLARGIYGMPSTEPWHGFDARQRILRMFAKAFGEAPD